VTSALIRADVEVAGTDGCGAPTIACTLHALATGYRSIALGDRGTAERAVFDAMTHHPEMCAGAGPRRHGPHCAPCRD
jgi:L-asparaginase II